MGVRVKVPNGAQHEAVALVVHAGAAIPAEVERVLHHLGVVARERNDRSGVRVVVDDFAKGVGSKELVIVVKALVQLHSQAVVDGIGAALEFLNASKAGDGARLSDAVHRGGLSGISETDGYRGLGTLLIDVQCAREMCAFDPQIVDLNGQARSNQVFKAQVRLLHIGLVIIGLEDINGGSARGAPDRCGTAGSRDGSPALGGGILRDVCAGEVESLNV